MIVMSKGMYSTKSYEIHELLYVNLFCLLCLLDLCNYCGSIKLSTFYHLFYVHFHHGCVLNVMNGLAFVKK
jgi:hypothetical protein